MTVGSLAVIIGLAAITYIMFDLWFNLREDHPNLSVIFFAFGMAIMNFLTFAIKMIMSNDAELTYLAPIGDNFFLIIMWLSIIVSLYVFFSTFWTFLKLTFDFIGDSFGIKNIVGKK